MYKINLFASDNIDWNTWISNISAADFYFTSEYMGLFQSLTGDHARLFIAGSNEHYIAYPFFIRMIPFSSPALNLETFFDIISPWYYGGWLEYNPLNKSSEKLHRFFLYEFHRFCVENKIVSEFGRLHPFVSSKILDDKTITFRNAGKIAFIDLHKDIADIWDDFSSNNRNKIRKAINFPIKISSSCSGYEISRFYEIYTQWMKSIHAADRYFFPKSFFDSLISLNKFSKLLIAEYENQVIGGLLLLGNQIYSHSYLSASMPEFRMSGVNNILKYFGLLFSKKAGQRYFLLGGGHQGNDSLWKFKKGFSKASMDFKIFYTIHLPEIYNSLCQEAFSRIATLPSNFYFPEYRYEL